MSKNRIVILVSLLLLVVVPFMNVGAQDQTIAELAAGNPDLSTLVSLVDAAGLTDLLSDPAAGPYTVFAPTNEAFAEVPQVALDYLAANPEVLTRVLTYHVLPAEVMSANITESMMADSAEMPSVGGEMTGSQLNVQVSDAGITVNGANVVAADVDASNGVVHVIDQVLIPDLSDLLAEVVPATLSGDIAIDGSSTVEPLTVAMQEAFQGEGFAGNISVGESGTGGGFSAFCEEGVIDIANASRAIRSGEGEEASICEANGRPAVPFRVGTDGIAVVVSASNDFATDVTYEELQAIFSTAANWSDVRADWPAEPILRYTPGTDSGTFDFFNEEVFPDADPVPTLAATNLTQSENDNVLVQGVESSPYAVGYFGYAYYLANADALKLVSIDGVSPNETSVEDGSYLLSRPLYIYSTPAIVQEKPQVAGFIQYYLQNVDSLIGDVGYFPASDAALNRAVLWLLAAGTPAA